VSENATSLAVIAQQAADLTHEEQQRVMDVTTRINIHDTTAIARYGESAQNKSAQISESALKGAKGKDLGTIGSDITNLVAQIKGFRPEDEKKGLARLFQKSKNQSTTMRAQYADVSKRINQIKNILEGHRITLLVDIKTLDQLFDENMRYCKELTIYIAAGKQKLADIENRELKQLQAAATASKSQEDIQRMNDLSERYHRFEKRIHDLELTRTICFQMAPQIRMVQGANVMMADKILASVTHTIPLWKNQMLLALGLQNSKYAVDAQRQVANETNQLLRRNADRLKTSVIEATHESERSSVDIETLMHANEGIIETLDEILTIQQDGRKKRHQAEVELIDIEQQLKARRLTLAQSSAN